LHSLSGHSFADSLRAGAYAVVKGQATLDRINVFPVADADTGANLAATLTAAAAGLGRTPPPGIGMAARMAADAALIGARGNSGAIFAQFLHGLAEGLHSKHDVAAGEFALAAAGGVQSAYLAVQHPREGTILSVLKAWARELAENADRVPDFRDLMSHALDAARVALAATPTQLQVLARNRVVDAGGQGFVYFLEGMLDPLHGRHSSGLEVLESLTFPAAYEEVTGASGSHARGFVASGPGRTQAQDARIDDHFRYCAEALIAGEKLDRETIRLAVGHLGESLVMAGGTHHMRVHLHTNEPAAFRGALEAVATVDSFKIDDMVAQQAAAKAATIALVTDSTVDLPEAAQLRLRMVMVPLTVSVAGKTYLDRVELSSADFYTLVRGLDELPRTSQPSRADFRRVYETLLEDHESVVSIHLSPRMSGTYQSAVGAASDVGPVRVRVVDARHLSVGLGLVVEAAGAAIQAGASLEQVVAAAEAAARNTRVYGATPSLDYAVKGGRVNSKLAWLAGLVELKPAILFDEEGAARAAGGHFGFNRAIRGIARQAADFTAGGPARVAIAHADSPASVAYLLQQLRKRFGPDQDIPMMECGSVLATHAGLGAVAIGVRRLGPQEGGTR
jgi:fatty acid kinase/fatty acid kinase fatty acid binding subunit